LKPFAGFWARFVAFLLDNIVLGALTLLVVRILAIGLPAGTPTEAMEGVKVYVGGLHIETTIGALLAWLYWAGLESSRYQATLGKLALGICVTDMEGKRISFLRATGRYFGKILSGLTLFLGFMMAGWTKRKQALHDIMASCVVIFK